MPPTPREQLRERLRSIRYLLINERSAPKLLEHARTAADFLAEVDASLESPSAADFNLLTALAMIFASVKPTTNVTVPLKRRYYVDDASQFDDGMDLLRDICKYEEPGL